MKTRRIFNTFCVAVWLAAQTAVSVRAATTTITATRETAIFAENPDYNLGVGNLIVGTSASGADTARSLLAFELAAAIPAGSRINSVTFAIGVIRQSNHNVESAYALHRFLKDWTEGRGGAGVNNGSPALPGETTWNRQAHGGTAWNAPGTQVGTEFTAAASGTGPVIDSIGITYTIDSTAALVADVQAWLDTPAANKGWIFRGTSEGAAGTARRFSSKAVVDGTSAGLIPRITVDYTPGVVAAAPGPIHALGGVALGIALFVWRTRRGWVR